MLLRYCKCFLGKKHQYNIACRKMVYRNIAQEVNLFTKMLDLLQYFDSEFL